MDAETSKAQLRARIRSERAARAAAVAESTPAESDSAVADVEPSVADAAWKLVERLWPDLDLTGRSLLAYAALAGEPDLDPIIDSFLAHGGTVYLPVVTKLGQPLRFGAITKTMGTLEPHGKWGIREPSPSLTASDLFSAEVAPDLVFMPALGFGSGGARLGNGGGFYDRTFGPQGEVPLDAHDRKTPDDARGSADVVVCGVCFASELDLPELSAESWDLQITRAVTNHGVHTFERACG